jgi:hypothetical protein
MLIRRPGRFTIPLLVALGCVACDRRTDAPSPPQIAPPATVAPVTPVEDRGQQQAGKVATPDDEQSAFSHVEGGAAERAASQRGHQSAAETTPAPQPGSGG